MPEGVTYVVTRSINDAGGVVGDNPTPEGPPLAWHWSEAEGARYLDDLVDLPSDWHLRRAWMIEGEGSGGGRGRGFEAFADPVWTASSGCRVTQDA